MQWFFVIPLIALILTSFQRFSESFLLETVAVVALLSMGVWRLLTRQTSLVINPITIGAIFLLLIMILGAGMSAIPYTAWSHLPLYTLIPVLLLTMAPCDRFFKWVILFFAFLAVGALAQFFIMDWGKHPYQAVWPFFNPNSLGILLGFGAIGSGIFMIMTKDLKKQYAMAGVLVLCVLAIHTTHSRSVMLGLGVSGVFAVMMAGLYKLNELKRRIVPIGGVLVAIALGLFLMNGYSDNLLHTESLATGIKESRDYERFAIWEGSLSTALQEKPVSGTGVGTYAQIYPAYQLPGDISSGLHAHNDILHLFVEIGMLGICAWFMMLVGVLWAFIKHHKNFTAQAWIAFSSLLYAGVVAQFTTVILLWPAVIYMGCCLAVMGRYAPNIYDLKGKYNDAFRQVMAFFAIIIMVIAVAGATVQWHGLRLKSIILSGDIKEMLAVNDQIDMWSMDLQPSVPVFRAATLLSLVKGGNIPAEKRDEALTEIQSYLNDGYRRNPHNPEIAFYRAELLFFNKEYDQAMEAYKGVLALDARYVQARIRLADLYEHNGDTQTARQILMDGRSLPYWKTDAKTYFDRIEKVPQK